ncbi:hypothetical protein [Actinoplanes philippinensis]|nr:hypothetical protein [Actinoplanes philippinensis]
MPIAHHDFVVPAQAVPGVRDDRLGERHPRERMESGTVALLGSTIPALVWIVASVDAIRRSTGEFTACGMSKRGWTGLLLLSMLAGLGPVVALAYLFVAVPRLRRGRHG